MPLLADSDALRFTGRPAGRVDGAEEARPHPRRGGARVHHRRCGRMPARLRVRGRAQAGEAAVADGQREVRSSTATTSWSCMPTRSTAGSESSSTTTCSPPAGRRRRSASSWSSSAGRSSASRSSSRSTSSTVASTADYDVFSIHHNGRDVPPVCGTSSVCVSVYNLRHVRRADPGTRSRAPAAARRARPAVRLPRAHAATWRGASGRVPRALRVPVREEHLGLVTHDELDWGPPSGSAPVPS